MFEPVSTRDAIDLLVKYASSWLPAISDAFLGKGAELTLGWLGDQRRKVFHLDEKEQKRHLELALKNAAERGLARSQDKEETQLYNEVIRVLSTPQAGTLRREALRLFTLNNEPDFKKLATLFDQTRSQIQPAQVQTIDAEPFLGRFFNSLVAELYADPYFRQQVSDLLRVRAEMNIQRSLTEVLGTLNRIGETLADNYTPEQFEKDVQAYTAHIARTLHTLKLVGVVPERTNENRDPELDDIFVPLRFEEKRVRPVKQWESLVDLLDKTSCLVLLGSPGSGKSTATRHLAWSHAVANLSNSTSPTNAPLLSGRPLPLRIELRRLNEDRRQRPDYDFLTYASEVLLKGLDIPVEMFKQLLERRAMLILFDGLDEVATLNDRYTLVGEIESFARQYPGNRFLVTSRPVGYNVAPLSTQIFIENTVQPFDNEQIHQFLKNWYAHVLRLSPLSEGDEKELEELYINLKDNPRLRALAENPLLLTVITALHRYKRLPDKRILVYDECADLLLENWARLKGTNVRWQDLQLSKEDQYACVAYLGFILHERSQQENTANAKGTGRPSNGDLANDVSARFMLDGIKHFLQHQNLFPSRAEQNKQASRFLDLIKEEAGLIVERGIDESGESLYSFVHRTFQEYFAAADVYERYQQEEDASIISNFLKEHLHDPHWSEVVLLLFGKLKRGPATKQLRQILAGTLKIRRGNYTDIVQQNLFFACDCLIEDIAIENDLTEAIISQLTDLVTNSPFPTQQKIALETLERLMKTRQYAVSARQKLVALLKQEQITEIERKAQASLLLFDNSPDSTEERQISLQLLTQLIRHPKLSADTANSLTAKLYKQPLSTSNNERFTFDLFLQMVQHPDKFVDFILREVEIIKTYENNLRFANRLLSELHQCPILTVEQSIKVANKYRELNPQGSKKQGEANGWLLSIAQRSDIPAELAFQAAYDLYKGDLQEEEKQRTVQLMLQLIQRPDFAVRKVIGLIPYGETEKQLYIQLLLQLAQRSDLSVEQSIEIADKLYSTSGQDAEKQRLAIAMLLQIAEKPDLTTEQTARLCRVLYKTNLDEEHRQQPYLMLSQIIQYPQLTIEQTILAYQALYHISAIGSKEEEYAIHLLQQLVQNVDLSFEQLRLLASDFFEYHEEQRKSIEEVGKVAPQILLSYLQRPNLTIRQMIGGIEIFMQSETVQSSEPWDFLRSYANQANDLSFEEKIHIAEFLYSHRIHEMQAFLQSEQQSHLSIGQMIRLTDLFYRYSPPSSEVRSQATQALLEMARNEQISIEHRLEAATILLGKGNQTYGDRDFAVTVQTIYQIISLVGEKAAKEIFEQFLGYSSYAPDLTSDRVTDIPSMANLVGLELLPTRTRDRLYESLKKLVPQFGDMEDARKK